MLERELMLLGDLIRHWDGPGVAAHRVEVRGRVALVLEELRVIRRELDELDGEMAAYARGNGCGGLLLIALDG